MLDPTAPAGPPPVDDFFPPRPPRRRWLWLVAAAVALAAVVTGAVLFFTRDTDPNAALKALAKHDPSGAEACYVLRQWLQGGLVDDKTGKPDSVVLVSGALSEYVAKSTTPAILATVGPPVFDQATLDELNLADNFQFTNLRQLHAACRAQGAPMPPYTDSP